MGDEIFGLHGLSGHLNSCLSDCWHTLYSPTAWCLLLRGQGQEPGQMWSSQDGW